MECKSRKKGNRQRCMKPPVFGSCRALLQTWRYDSMSGHCKMLNYTICSLGITETATEEACLMACKGKKDLKIICSLTPRSTPCNFLHKLQWFFDARKNKCLQFPKGQCAKIANGFPTKEKCLERCSYETS
ncbi:kunitz-type serine protease inhibitor A-like isoform X2 [Rhipicephalus sanguineus]|nr:kunitz-type serine protease inhibitor A-like isoform X2 [Rhipicephalus sanguineus]